MGVVVLVVVIGAIYGAVHTRSEKEKCVDTINKLARDSGIPAGNADYACESMTAADRESASVTTSPSTTWADRYPSTTSAPTTTAVYIPPVTAPPVTLPPTTTTAPDPCKGKYPTVSLGALSQAPSSYGMSEVTVSGTIVNNTGMPLHMRSVDVTYGYRDQSGVVRDGYVMASMYDQPVLRPGGRMSFTGSSSSMGDRERTRTA